MNAEVKLLAVLISVTYIGVFIFLIAPAVFNRLARHVDCALADYDDVLDFPMTRTDSPAASPTLPGLRRALNRK